MIKRETVFSDSSGRKVIKVITGKGIHYEVITRSPSSVNTFVCYSRDLAFDTLRSSF